MTGTAVANIPANLPAFLQRQDLQAEAQKFNSSALGGIRIGGFPRISTLGGKFHIVDSTANPPRQLITAIDPNTGAALPAMLLSVVVVGANPGITKTYYENPYEQGSEEEPDCSSDNGVTPDPHIEYPESSACATCPQNAWGSRKVPADGKVSQAKACNDSKRLVVLSADDLQGKAYGLAVSATALKDWGILVKNLTSRGVPVYAARVAITFDPTVSYPKLKFTLERLLSEQEFNTVESRKNSDEVKNIEQPGLGRAAPALPAPTATQTPVNIPVVQAAPVVQAPPPPPPAPVVTVPVTPPPPADPLAGLPPETVAAINAVGGPDSQFGKQLLNAARGAAVAVVNQDLAAPPAMPDLDNTVAQAVAGVLQTPPTPKIGRGRPRKNSEAAPAPQPAPAATTSFGAPAPQPQPMQAQPAPEPAPQPAPVAAQTGFASSPQVVVAPAGSSLGNDLESLLAGVLNKQ